MAFESTLTQSGNHNWGIGGEVIGVRYSFDMGSKNKSRLLEDKIEQMPEESWIILLPESGDKEKKAERLIHLDTYVPKEIIGHKVIFSRQDKIRGLKKRLYDSTTGKTYEARSENYYTRAKDLVYEVLSYNFFRQIFFRNKTNPP